MGSEWLQAGSVIVAAAIGLVGVILGLRSERQARQAQGRRVIELSNQAQRNEEMAALRQEVADLRSIVKDYDVRYQQLLRDISGLRVAFTEMEVGVTTLIHQLEINGIEPAWRPDPGQLRSILPWHGDEE